MMDKKFDRNEIVAELTALGAKFKGNSCTCPFHDDKNPSSWIAESENGWYFKCAVCEDLIMDVYDLQSKRTNKSFKSILSTSRVPPVDLNKLYNGKIYLSISEALSAFNGVESFYKYTDPKSGVVDLLIIRQLIGGKKTFKQVTPTKGGFKLGGCSGLNPIYNRQRVLSSDVVVIVEGEKCVHALHDLGIVSTTSPGGALNFKRADWSPLFSKRIILWPDNDNSGQKYVEGIRDLIGKECKDIRLVDVSKTAMKEKDDVFDYIQDMIKQGATKSQQVDEIVDILNCADDFSPKDEFKEYLDSIVCGRVKQMSFLLDEFESLARITYPGTVTLLCGEPGCGKSWLLMTMFAYWHSSENKVSLFELEEDKKFWNTRLLSIMSGNSKLTDLKFISENPKLVSDQYVEFKPFIDSFDLNTFSEKMLTYEELGDLVEQKAKNGFECIGIDPITAVENGKDPWNSDKKFILRIKDIASKYGTRIFIVTHPKLGSYEKPTMESLGGSAAFTRFCQNVLWLKNFETLEYKNCLHNNEVIEQPINKMLRIVKGRNSKLMNGKFYGLLWDLNTFSWAGKGWLSK